MAAKRRAAFAALLYFRSSVTNPTYSRLLGYDRVNRLTSAGGQWGNGTIAYDGSGNIKSQVLGDIASLYYQYDGQNRLASVSGRWSGNYQYDAYGDIVGFSNGDIVYDGVPNLTCFNCNVSVQPPRLQNPSPIGQTSLIPTARSDHGNPRQETAILDPAL